MKKPDYLTKVKTEKVLVTPHHAEKWINNMRRNRPVSDRVVNQYARDMERGNWLLTHQGIAIDEDGQLIDGQHRLWAIVLTGKSVWMTVTTGLPSTTVNGSGLSIMDVTDQARPRDVGQQFHIQHGIKNSKLVAAACRVLAISCAPWCQKVSTPEAIQIYKMLAKPFQDFCQMAVGSKPKIGNSAALAAISFVSTIKPKEAEQFGRQLYYGEGLRRGMPAYQLRNFLLGNIVRSTKSTEVFMRTTCSAIRAYLEGREIAKLYSSDGAVEQIIGMNPDLRDGIIMLFPHFEKSARAIIK